MARKKREIVDESEMRTIRITGPECRFGTRHYLPGETVTVPADVAEGWILGQRAVEVAAEVKSK